MWERAALPMGMLTDMERFFNQRLDGSKDDWKYRKTTVGECIRFCGYMGALAVERGCAVFPC